MKSCDQFERLIQNLVLDDISEVEKKLLNEHLQKSLFLTTLSEQDMAAAISLSECPS